MEEGRKEGKDRGDSRMNIQLASMRRRLPLRHIRIRARGDSQVVAFACLYRRVRFPASLCIRIFENLRRRGPETRLEVSLFREIGNSFASPDFGPARSDRSRESGICGLRRDTLFSMFGASGEIAARETPRAELT